MRPTSVGTLPVKDPPGAKGSAAPKSLRAIARQHQQRSVSQLTAIQPASQRRARVGGQFGAAHTTYNSSTAVSRPYSVGMEPVQSTLPTRPLRGERRARTVRGQGRASHVRARPTFLSAARRATARPCAHGTRAPARGASATLGLIGAAAISRILGGRGDVQVGVGARTESPASSAGQSRTGRCH